MMNDEVDLLVGKIVPVTQVYVGLEPLGRHQAIGHKVKQQGVLLVPARRGDGTKAVKPCFA